MTRQQLIDQIRKKKSFLCIGLDSDINKIPSFLLEEEDPVFEFNKQIIDATHSLCVAYKPNIAFYEALGPSGWATLQKTIDYIPDDILVIADAKRGDIGNTSKQYAEAFFNKLACDAITVAPYMGEDSVTPFLEYTGKWVILLILTSNKGSRDFQTLDFDGEKLYETVLERSLLWGSPENLMFVVGATHPEDFLNIRNLAPDHFLLVPGVGAQGGTLGDVVQYGFNADCGLLVNASRSIIFASDGDDFTSQAYEAALDLQQQMAQILSERNF